MNAWCQCGRPATVRISEEGDALCRGCVIEALGGWVDLSNRSRQRSEENMRITRSLVETAGIEPAQRSHQRRPPCR